MPCNTEGTFPLVALVRVNLSTWYGNLWLSQLNVNLISFLNVVSSTNCIPLASIVSGLWPTTNAYISYKPFIYLGPVSFGDTHGAVLLEFWECFTIKATCCDARWTLVVKHQEELCSLDQQELNAAQRGWSKWDHVTVMLGHMRKGAVNNECCYLGVHLQYYEHWMPIAEYMCKSKLGLNYIQNVRIINVEACGIS